MNVICLYWVGKFRGRDFVFDDIMRLYASILKYMDRDFTFYCLTNYDGYLPFETIELKHDWPGWWAKVELHRPDLPPGRTLYLDLDSHVISSLQPILDYPGDLVMFNTKATPTPQPGLVRRYQAATMLFDSGTPGMVQLYDRFKEDPAKYMERYRSEQDIMGDWLPNQPTFPDSWMVKLGECKKSKTVSKDCIIVTGQPRDFDFRQASEINWIRI